MRQSEGHPTAGARPNMVLRFAAVLGFLVAALSAAGCDQLLDVEPQQIIEEDAVFRDPLNSDLLVRSVANAFERAFHTYIVTAGLVGNELENGTTFANFTEEDSRTFEYPRSTAYVGTVYTPLSRARWLGDRVFQSLQNWTDAEVANRRAKMARVAAYSGYARVLLAEGMCTVAFDVGPELTPNEVLAQAEAIFTEAISDAQAANDNSLEAWARVGRARVRARLGRLADAAADAQMVPGGFVFEALYDDTRQNHVWSVNVSRAELTVSPSYRNLMWNGVPDPRVKVQDAGRAAWDGNTHLWLQTKYTTSSASIPVASWREARLIMAEAAAVSGDLATAVSIINELHTHAGIPATFASNGAAEVLEQIVEERQRELFLESHHLADIRQYGIPLDPAPGTLYKNGLVWVGDKTCFPLPEVERANNPNFR